jgi:hypothetical protein
VTAFLPALNDRGSSPYVLLKMLDTADALIAVWKPSVLTGGTFNALAEAARRGLPGIHINPENQTVNFQLPDPGRGRGKTLPANAALPTL